MALDFEVARRLAFIRYLHQMGVDQARLPAPLSSASLLMLHDAIESFYVLACEQLGINATFEFEKFPSAINAAIAGGRTLVGQATAMKRINNARKMLKHHGTHPDKTTIELAVQDTATFMAGNTPTLFDVEYDTVSMADAITQEKVRALVKAAEAANAAGDRVEAMCSLAHAMTRLLTPHTRGDDYETDPSPFALEAAFGWPMTESTIQDAFTPRVQGGDSRLRVYAGRESRQVARQLKRTFDVVKKLGESVRLLGLGVDPASYERFEMLTPAIEGYFNGDLEFYALKGYAPTAEEYQFCHQFVVGCAIRFAAVEANLASPAWRPPRQQRHWEALKRIPMDEDD